MIKNIYYKITTFLILKLLCYDLFSQELNPISYRNSSKTKIYSQALKKKKVVKILSIDGGGIRGIIPAYVLKNLESRLKKKQLVDCFDLMAGTSTGGIIVLLLNTPNDLGKPKYNADQVYEFYKSFGIQAFTESRWQYLKSFNGWIEEKYSAKNLEDLLEKYLGRIPLSQSLTDILIPAYDVGSNEAVFFKTTEAKKNKEENFYMKDIARATSAAPTYFKPARIKDFTNQEYILVDGGMSANNPTLSACVYAIELYGEDVEFFIISLGTGNGFGTSENDIYTDSKVIKGGIFHWGQEITSLLMYSASNVIDYQLKVLLNNKTKSQYFRFQIDLEGKMSEMDNVEGTNIEILEKFAQKIIYQNDKKLDSIAQFLESS